MERQIDQVKIKIRPIIGNGWCLVLILPTTQEYEFLNGYLDNNIIETYLFLNGTKLNILINMPEKGKDFTFRNIPATPPQRSIIESKQITEISFWSAEIDVPNDVPCRHANVKYPEY